MSGFLGRTAAALLLSVVPVFSASHRIRDDGGAFQAGGCLFTLPAQWIAETPETPVRAGEWRVRGRGGEGRVVAFYFGPGKGGEPKQIVTDWIGTMFNAEGHPAAAEVKNREKNGAKISQVVVFGTYSETVPIAGLPPVSRPGYGLVGTVVTGPQGNIYWRFTGPEPLITANLALFNQAIDSVRVQNSGK